MDERIDRDFARPVRRPVRLTLELGHATLGEEVLEGIPSKGKNERGFQESNLLGEPAGAGT